MDRRVATRFPANVLGGFEPDVGATYFNLTDLHDEYKEEPGTVIAAGARRNGVPAVRHALAVADSIDVHCCSADFYGASSMLPLSDEAIVKKTLANISACEPAFADAKVVDSAVLRFPRAVTKFSPGSHQNRPRQLTSFGNVMLAGDWVKGLEHGANGLSQERAWVSGLAAANLVVAELGRAIRQRSCRWSPMSRIF